MDSGLIASFRLKQQSNESERLYCMERETMNKGITSIVILVCVFVALQASAASSGKPLYEENPVATMAIREKQWRQMQAYANARSTSKASSGNFTTNFTGSADYLDKMKPLRQTLRDRIGYPPPGLFTDVQERLEKIGEDALATYYRCTIPVSPEMEVYGLYLVPRHAIFPVPLVITQHGGGGFPELALFRGGANYHDLVRGPLRYGWIVFAPHHIYYPYGDRDHGTPLPKQVREQLDDQLRKRGTTIAAVEVAKIAKALDALLRRPEVDPNRVAMTGLSYGGYYTLYTAALDARIRVAVPSCSFVKWGQITGNSVRDIRTGGKLCELEPWELACLICPRPLQIQAGRQDPLLKFEQTVPQAEKAATVYRTQGQSHQFAFAPFAGGHDFNGELAWRFLERFLAPIQSETPSDSQKKRNSNLQ
jgi:prolyl oligopeptidase family protein